MKFVEKYANAFRYAVEQNGNNPVQVAIFYDRSYMNVTLYQDYLSFFCKECNSTIDADYTTSDNGLWQKVHHRLLTVIYYKVVEMFPNCPRS